MAALQAQITEAMKDAMRAKDKPRLGTLRMMLAECKRIEVDERLDGLPDERVLAVLDKMTKQRKDSAQQYRDNQRPELAEQEEYEITVITEFLPAALSDAELQQLIQQAIADTGAESAKDMGKVMGVLKPQVQGRADMGAVSGLVKQTLS